MNKISILYHEKPRDIEEKVLIINYTTYTAHEMFSFIISLSEILSSNIRRLKQQTLYVLKAQNIDQ